MWTVSALGAAATLFSAFHLPVRELGLHYSLLALITVGIGSRGTIRIPRTKGQITVADTFIFLTVLIFGGEAAVILAALEALYSSTRFSKSARVILFNSAAVGLSTFVTVWALRSSVGPAVSLPGGIAAPFIVALCLMAITQYGMNSGLIATAVALRTGQPLWLTWKNNFLWTSITYIAGAAAAGMIAKLIAAFGFYAFLASAPIIAVIYWTYQTYLRNVEASVTQAEQAKRHVEELSHYIAEQERIGKALQESEEHFRSAFDNAAIGMALVEPDGRFLQVNSSMCGLVGYSEQELLAMSAQQIIHPEDLDKDLRLKAQLIEGAIRAAQIEKRYLHKNEHEVWVSASLSLVRDAQGAPLHFIAQVQDVTDRKRAEETLKSLSLVDELTGLYNRRGFLALADQHYNLARRSNKKLMVFYADLDGMKQINDTYGHKEGDQALVKTAEILRETFRQSDVIARLGGDEFTVLASGASEASAELLSARLREKIQRFNEQSGHRYNLAVSIGVAHFGFDGPFSVEELMVRADQAMYENKKENKKKRSAVANPTHAEEALPSTAPDMRGEGARPAKHLTPDTSNEQNVAGGTSHAGGPRHRGAGPPSCGSSVDLPDLAWFTEQLKLAAERVGQSDGYQFAVLFVDLDNFKYVNNSFGPEYGDVLLSALAPRLRGCLRQDDTVAHLEGDKFAVLVDAINGRDDAIGVVARIEKELNSPFSFDGREVFTTASIGVALSETGFRMPQDVLRNAETAMYCAKAHGKARYEMFDEHMHAQALIRLQLETDLRHAIERGEFRVHYQPVISIRTGRISGFEALVRWQHPVRGLISPAEFIPAAEETGIIMSIGQWVLREACRQMRRWQEQLPSEDAMTLSVNLSAKQFTQAGLVENVKEILQETGFDPRRLQLEITESTAMEDAQGAATTLTRLRSLGVQVSIDDFGTGHSSLSYLHRFPASTLKIDRSFIGRMCDSHEHFEIARVIVTLASALNMNVVAEGVETREQLIKLGELGCGYAQGYLFSKPVDARGVDSMVGEMRLQMGEPYPASHRLAVAACA